MRRRLRHAALALALVAAAETSALGQASPSPTPTPKGMAAQVCAEAPHTLLLRIARGSRVDRSGDIQMLAKFPNYVDGGLTHAGPWPYVQDVPMLWYGPGFIKPGQTVQRPVTLADIAPTEGSILHFDGFHAPDGTPMTEALVPNAPPPKLLVVMVWDAGGRDVLAAHANDWPNLKALIPQGTWYENATVGDSPSNTPTGHATIGTGAFPVHNGFIDDYVRINDRIVKPNDAGPGSLIAPTLADVYDRAMDNKPIVGTVATLSAHVMMMSHGAMWGGGDRDIAVTREVAGAATAGAEGVSWNLTPAMAPFYRLPKYVNSVPGFQRDVRTLDAADGKIDGKWRQNDIQSLNFGFDTPARTPYQTSLIEEVVSREHFGQDDVPDLLYLNYKAIDTIGHRYSLNSPEMADAVKWQDRDLPVLIKYLNRQVGRGQWAMVLTADHGHQYDPAVSGAFQIGIDQLNADVMKRFDTDGDNVPLIQRLRPTEMWLNPDDLARNHATLAQISQYIQGLTQVETLKPNHQVIPGHGDDPVFQSVFPTSLIPDLPCLPKSFRGP